MVNPKTAEDSEGVAASKGVDVDPTKNVLDLVNAESKFQDAMRRAEAKYQDGMRDANDRRQNDLSTMRDGYEGRIKSITEYCEHRIADMNQKQVESLAVLRSGQLDGLDKRLVRLEVAGAEERGKTSVADPALANVLKEMAFTLNNLKGSTDTGRTQVVAWVIAAGMALFALIAAIVPILNYTTK